MGEFKCGFGAAISEFIGQKRSSGADYRTDELTLRGLDSLAASMFPGEATLTEAIFNAWVGSQRSLHVNTLIRRLPAIRQLSRFMAVTMPGTYVVPMGNSPRGIRYQPHLVTREELRAFFRELDALCGKGANPAYPERALVLPAMFRIYYACGLRAAEAVRLRCDDVDLGTGRLVIRESKAHRMRIVPMHPDLTALCVEYDRRMSALHPSREAFFCNGGGGFINPHMPTLWFRWIWGKCQLSSQGGGPPFTLHCLRHNFITTVISRWHGNGGMASAMLPCLMLYTGHSRVGDLDYYAHLNDVASEQCRETMGTLDSELLPEVAHGC